jgi:hypothetical protein
MADNSHQSDGKSFTWLVGQMRKKYENITYTPDKYLNKEPQLIYIQVSEYRLLGASGFIKFVDIHTYIF